MNGLAFSPDGASLASCSDDATIRLWDPLTGRAKWRGPALLTRPVRLWSHRGWQTLAGGEAPDDARAWRASIETRAVYVEEATAPLGCLQTESAVELWDVSADRPIRTSERAVTALRALPAGCVAADRDSLLILTREAEVSRPARAVSALAWLPPADGLFPAGAIAAASEGDLVAFDPRGAELARIHVGEGVTAIARARPDALIVGYRDGGIELVDAHGRLAGAPTFEQVPASAAARIVLGPGGTAAIGYADGTVGLWNLGDGKQFARERIHGRAHHLLVDGHELFAASDLGDSLRWDLAAFDRDYCDLLRQIWAAVPVVWSSGSAVESVPVHRCNAQ